MNIKAFKSICVMLALIISTVLTSTISFANIIDSTSNNDEVKPYVLNIDIGESRELQPILLSKSLGINSFQTTSIQGFDDIVVANESYDEYRPSVIVSGNNLLTLYEIFDKNQSNVYVKHSNNFGQSWSSVYSWEKDEDTSYFSPSLSHVPKSKKAYGAFVSSKTNASEFYVAKFDNMNNIGVASSINWGEYGFHNFSQIEILSYPNTNYPWVVGLIGSTTFEDETTGEGPCVDSPMMSFISTEDSSKYTIYWEPSFEGCSNLSLGMDYEKNQTVYAVCEIKNGTNQDVLFFKGTPTGWNADDPLFNYTFSGSESLTHPKIAVRENKVYIVMQTDKGGENEIIIYSSADGGQTWALENVTSDILSADANPAYPDLYINETHMICSFIESGNLTVTKSPLTEFNWTEPIQINSVNGTVESGYHYTDIGDSNCFIWTDKRDENLDIYFYVDYIPKVDLELVKINLTGDLKPFKTNNLLQITVKNNGDATAYNIKSNVTFSFDDGNDTCAENLFEIGYLLPGQEMTIEREIFNFMMPDFLYAFINFAGINNITVEIDPDGLTDDIDTSNNRATKAVTYEDIFPIMGRYEQTFLLIKRFLSSS